MANRNAFKIGERVRIKINEVNGEVVGIYYGKEGMVRFDVEYSDGDGVIQSSYRYEDELEKI